MRYFNKPPHSSSACIHLLFGQIRGHRTLLLCAWAKLPLGVCLCLALVSTRTPACCPNNPHVRREAARLRLSLSLASARKRMRSHRIASMLGYSRRRCAATVSVEREPRCLSLTFSVGDTFWRLCTLYTGYRVHEYGSKCTVHSAQFSAHTTN